MRFRNKPRDQGSLIDIAPFMDTVFNLLIFFALSLNFISTPGIRVNLPQSTAQEIVRQEEDLRIVISSDQELYLNEKRIEKKELVDRFQSAGLNNTQTQILIQADKRVAHGTVVWVMDQARSAGLHRLAIITQPKGEAEEK